MKLSIEVLPNRERGYDATVYCARSCEPLQTCNAPSEAKARELAQVWIDWTNELAKGQRKRRALSDGELETREAARNEERAHGTLPGYVDE